MILNTGEKDVRADAFTHVKYSRGD